MTREPKNTCARVWQAEAVADGRLSPADRASFARHLETCATCQGEHAAIERLHEVAWRLPAEESTPLRRRFLHNELLRRANERALGKEHGRTLADRRWVLALAAALCAAVAAFVGFSRSGSERPSTVANGPDEPHFEIAAAGGHWHALQRGPALRLAVSPGTYTVSVTKLHTGQSFVIVLPDGELEVRGTRFELAVDAKTRRVAVSEGRVALRLRGEPELALAAGDSWPAVAGPGPSTPPIRPAPPSASRRDPATPSARVVRERTVPRAVPSSSGGTASSVEPSSAASEFATAMAAFSRGDFATAEQLFLAFEVRHPHNAHVEDTLFLRAVGRLRRGDEAGARTLSRQYLQRYPAGFRAVEARRMAK